jgi:hypothetical protein
MFPNFVRRYSAAGTYCTPDECALTAAHQSTYDSSACRCTANYFCGIVMALIMSILLPLRLTMLFLSLRHRDYRLRENGCEDSADCNRFKLRHFLILLQSQSRFLKM